MQAPEFLFEYQCSSERKKYSAASKTKRILSIASAAVVKADQPVHLWGPADDAAAAALAAALDADEAPLDADKEAAAAWCSRRAKPWSAETAGQWQQELWHCLAWRKLTSARTHACAHVGREPKAAENLCVQTISCINQSWEHSARPDGLIVILTIDAYCSSADSCARQLIDASYQVSDMVSAPSAFSNLVDGCIV